MGDPGWRKVGDPRPWRSCLPLSAWAPASTGFLGVFPLTAPPPPHTHDSHTHALTDGSARKES